MYSMWLELKSCFTILTLYVLERRWKFYDILIYNKEISDSLSSETDPEISSFYRKKVKLGKKGQRMERGKRSEVGGCGVVRRRGSRLDLQIIRKDVNDGLSLAIKCDYLEVLAGGGAGCFLGFVDDDGGLLEEIEDEGFSSFGVLAFSFRFAF